MDEGLLHNVKKRVHTQTPKNIVTNLTKKGYEKEHIEKAINVYKPQSKEHPAKWIVAKEVTERIDSGMRSQQYLNILLSVLEAPFFVIGMFSGLRTLLDVLLTAYMTEFNSIRTLKKATIALGGVVTAGFFVMMGYAVQIENMWLFVIGMLCSGVGIVILGDTYKKLSNSVIKAEHRGFVLSKLPQIGLIFVAIGLLFGGYLLNQNQSLTAFAIMALLFFISGLCIIPLYRNDNQMNTTILALSKELWTKTVSNMQKLLRQRVILILFITSTITGVVQTLGTAFFGIFIYRSFLTQALGGYLNVGLVFLIAAGTTVVSPTIARLLSKQYGTIPQLVFGTLLIAILPLAYWYTPYLLALSMATMLGIIGAAIVSLASGLLVKNQLGESEQAMYYRSFPLIVVIPYILTVPLGAWMANIIGLKFFFLTLALILLVGVTPLYFSLLYHKRVI